MSLDTFLPIVARAYTSAVHDPMYPTVASSYASLKRQLLRQYEQQVAARYTVTFTDVDPYADCLQLFADMDRNRLAVYTVDDMPADHPFCEVSPIGVSYNVVFRAVHDAIAHYPQRNDFTYAGEFRAFLAHAKWLTPLAQWALFTETVGQNAYPLWPGRQHAA